MPVALPEPAIVGRPDGSYQVVYAGRVLATCDSYMEAADWIEERRAAMSDVLRCDGLANSSPLDGTTVRLP